MNIRKILESSIIPSQFHPITAFLPRVRDALTFKGDENKAQWIEHTFAPDGKVHSLTGDLPVRSLCRTLLRVAVAAAFLFAMIRLVPVSASPKYTIFSLGVSALLLSTPATGIALGGGMMGAGTLFLTRGIASASFSLITRGALDFGVGYFLLMKGPDWFPPRGLAEPAFSYLANKATPLANLFIPAKTKQMVEEHYAQRDQEMQPLRRNDWDTRESKSSAT